MVRKGEDGHRAAVGNHRGPGAALQESRGGPACACSYFMILQDLALAREDIDEAVYAILFRENCIAKRLDTYFQHLDAFKERKKELLHKKWTENVAKPLQQRIMEKVISYKALEKTKQENFEYFLKHTNKTEIIFGDFYDPEVYNPFYMTKKDPNYGKVAVPPFCDPLFRRQQERDEEQRAVFQYTTGTL
ncbi:protein FAM228A-like [Bos javanicus]|uniref:protein FAM228A-like n=1 Tax=Bos javanicus TaxID=9906 RepID=UPI002AA8D370|nr:protein FAM228A-like [Bos javanicus]